MGFIAINHIYSQRTFKTVLMKVISSLGKKWRLRHFDVRLRTRVQLNDVRLVLFGEHSL